MRVFFDSSAFVKRNVREADSEAVLDWCDQATEIGLSTIEDAANHRKIPGVRPVDSSFCHPEYDSGNARQIEP